VLDVSTFAAIAIALFVLASLWLLWHGVRPMRKVADQEYGPRMTRLISWRMLRAVAVWECAVGLVIIETGQWVNSIGLFGMGLIVWMTAAGKRRGLI
jgi:hypothetical protein